jgi:hypothetical protein
MANSTALQSPAPIADTEPVLLILTLPLIVVGVLGIILIDRLSSRHY